MSGRSAKAADPPPGAAAAAAAATIPIFTTAPPPSLANSGVVFPPESSSGLAVNENCTLLLVKPVAELRTWREVRPGATLLWVGTGQRRCRGPTRTARELGESGTPPPPNTQRRESWSESSAAEPAAEPRLLPKTSRTMLIFMFIFSKMPPLSLSLALSLSSTAALVGETLVRMGVVPSLYLNESVLESSSSVPSSVPPPSPPSPPSPSRGRPESLTTMVTFDTDG